MIDEKLKTFATETQAKYIDAINEHGNAAKAAKALGVVHSSICRSMASLRKSAAIRGYSPEHDLTHAVPSPLVLRGTSTLYGGDGKVLIQWVKTKLDAQQVAEAIRDFVADLVQDAKGLAKPIAPPKLVMEDLLTVYPMGDPHFGMYAWGKESGEDFDLDTAEKLTCAAIDRLVASAPPSETALLLELGDFFHADNNSNQTARSGNALDVDTRWARVMQVGRRAMVHIIKRLLEKHKRVIVRIVKGNHDDHSSYALAMMLDAYFDKEPRVEIDLSPAAHWYYKFGKVLIGSTHGDMGKMKDLPGVMAADRAKDWGLTEQRYWYIGHVHHDEVQEYPGVKCESFRTLAAKDAWHAGMGYRAGRDMRCIVHHKDFGEIERHRCDIAMIRAA